MDSDGFTFTLYISVELHYIKIPGLPAKANKISTLFHSCASLIHLTFSYVIYYHRLPCLELTNVVMLSEQKCDTTSQLMGRW